jgi:tetratricopeptide (TPR) repeat protein
LWKVDRLSERGEAPGEVDAKVAWLWKQVEQARDSGDAEAARESLTRLLADPAVHGTPDEDLAMLHLSQMELEEGRVTEVARRMGDFRWNARPGPAALLLAADVYLKLDWFEQSLGALDRYLREIPDDLDARRKKGLVLLMLDRDDEAERALLAVARRERYRVPATLAYLAMLEAKNDRLEESLHLLMQARDLAPFDRRIEHTLLRVEALRVRLRRRALSSEGLPLEDVVGGMVSGMMELHGYTEERARYARDVWNHFCALQTPTGRKPAIWAAALEYAVTRNGPHLSQEELAEEYGVSVSQLREHYKTLSSSVDLRASGDLLAEAASQGSALSSLVRREELAEVLAGAVRRLSDFDTEAEAVAWVFDRMDPAGEEERREVEDFLRFIWNRRR